MLPERQIGFGTSKNDSQNFSFKKEMLSGGRQKEIFKISDIQSNRYVAQKYNLSQIKIFGAKKRLRDPKHKLF